MCINLEWSLATYVIGSIGCAILLSQSSNGAAAQLTRRFYALWLLYILQMQLLEAAMHYDADCSLGWNQTASKIGFYYTALQPLVGCLLLYWLMPRSVGANWMSFVVLAYAFVLMRHFTRYRWQPQNNYCTRKCGAHLQWKWLQLGNDPWVAVAWVVAFFLPVLYLAAVYPKIALVPAAYMVGSCAYSFASNRFRSAPSVWCILQLLAPYVVAII